MKNPLSSNLLLDIITKLDEEIIFCQKCDLCKSRTNAVPGIGPLNAPIMIVGEAPGVNEDIHGIPFAGASGVVLDELLGLAGLTRNQVFITNLVKCRPPENRDPKQIEVESCSHYLTLQMNIIKPSIIITLGRHPLYFLLNKEKTITELHGKPIPRNGYYLLPMYHPANMFYRRYKIKPVMESDFKKLGEFILAIKSGKIAKYPEER